MKKMILILLIALFLFPSVALAEGEDVPPEVTPPPEESPVPSEGEAEPEAPIPEQGNSIIITDANGNQYVITADKLTGATTTPEPTAEALEADAGGNEDIITALQAQGLNISPDALKAALAELGLDAVGLTATLQAASVRPMLTTCFADYTVLEGLLLILVVLTVVRMVFKLFAM